MSYCNSCHAIPSIVLHCNNIMLRKQRRVTGYQSVHDILRTAARSLMRKHHGWRRNRVQINTSSACRYTPRWCHRADHLIFRHAAPLPTRCFRIMLIEPLSRNIRIPALSEPSVSGYSRDKVSRTRALTSPLSWGKLRKRLQHIGENSIGNGDALVAKCNGTIANRYKAHALVSLQQWIENRHNVHAGALFKIMCHNAFSKPQIQNGQFPPAR